MTTIASHTGLLDIGNEPEFEADALQPHAVTDIDWNDPRAVQGLADFLWLNRGYKRRVEEQALRNISYVLGDQHHKMNRQRMTMEPDKKRPKYESRIIYNLILGVLQQRDSVMSRVETDWGTPPLTNDPEDQVVGRLLRDVAGYYYHQGLNIPTVLTKARMWAMMTKVGFIELNWDPQAGDPIPVTPDQFGLDQQSGQFDQERGFLEFAQQFGEGALQQGQATQFTGDLFAEAFSVFEMITWPFNALDWDTDVLIKMRTKQLTLRQAAAISGLPVEKIKTVKQSHHFEMNYRTRLANRNQSWAGGGSGGTYFNAQSGTGHDPDSEMVFVHYLWLDPKADRMRYPNGRKAIVVGDITVESSLGEIPFPNKRDPYFVFHEHKIPGSLYGTCTVDQMRSGQDDINDIVTSAANYRRRMVNPTIFVFPGSIMGRKGFNNAPGQVVQCTDPGRIPKILERPDLPSDYDRCIGWTMQFLNDVSGVADIDRGRTRESKVTSGIAIQRLQEKNQARMQGMAESIKTTAMQMGHFATELLQEFANDQRILHIIGENNIAELVTFDKHKLRPKHYGEPGTRAAMIRIDTAGALPSNRSEMQALIASLTDQQWLRPGEHDAIVFKALSMGEIKSPMDRERPDLASETNVIEMFREGQIPPPPRQTSSFSDRLKVLSQWINSDDYLIVIQNFPYVHQFASERVQQFKEGMAIQLVETAYLQRMADLRMHAKYLSLAVDAVNKGEIDGEMAEAAFAIPLGLQQAAAESEQSSGSSGGSKSSSKSSSSKSSKRSAA